MTDTTTPQSLGSASHNLRSRWPWFIVLGVGLLIAGGIASLNLVAATLVSILAIGAAMLAGAVMTFIQAFIVPGWTQKLLHGLAGLVYGLSGAIILHDPLLASVTLSLACGVLLCLTGILRVVVGLQAHRASGSGWIIAAGFFTIVTGGLIVGAWPAISMWLLGALLTFDLIFQGWGFIAFGLSLRPGHGAVQKASASPIVARP
jgi:uncharacterized membrane protein HdeD (DUF308 family)